MPTERLEPEPLEPERAIAQIHGASGEAVGLAFAVGGRHLVTCAHVVNSVLGRDPRSAANPGRVELRLAFPFAVRRDSPASAVGFVDNWLPRAGEDFDSSDVATVELAGQLPDGVPALAFTVTDQRGGAVQMWGPVRGHAWRGHVVGTVRGRTVGDRFQVDQEGGGAFRVRPGFSGGPAWKIDTGQVVGMVQACGPDDEALDAYVLDARRIIEACPWLAEVGPATRPLTVLHISGTRFGADGAGHLERDVVRSQALRLSTDVVDVRAGQRTDLVVVTGDVAHNGLRAEYAAAYTFLNTLRDNLEIDPERLVVVPGLGDVNLKLCEGYVLNQEGDGARALRPYWPKWRHFDTLFRRLYGRGLSRDEPWQFVKVPGADLVVAALNSTMDFSHLDTHRHGALGESQVLWFASRLARVPAAARRIAVVNHDPLGDCGAVDCAGDCGGLRDAALFRDMLAAKLDLVLQGRATIAEVRRDGPSGLPVVGPGGAAVRGWSRYQLVEVHPDGPRVLARQYDQGEWHYTARPAETGDGGRGAVPTRLVTVGAVAPAAGARPGRSSARDAAADEDLAADRLAESGPRRGSLLMRVEEVCRVRLPGAVVRAVQPTPEAAGYVHVESSRTVVGGRPVDVTQYPVGVCEGQATRADVDHFLATIAARYRDGALATFELVHAGPPADPELRECALGLGIALVSFADYQLGDDLREYGRRQAERLSRHSMYPSDLYVPQRYTEIDGLARPSGAAPVRSDLLAQLRGWLRDQEGHLVVVLGPFGHGKTFLLHELARRMHADGDPAVPILVRLRNLGITHTLDQLVAAELTDGGERRIDLDIFRYLLKEGRVALFLDGFDELADRLTYHRRVEHLGEIAAAAAGWAKVVLVSRDSHFLTDGEVISSLGGRLATVAGRRLVKLAGFDNDQIGAFLAKRLGGAEAGRRRLHLLRKVQDLLGLSRNPRMLDFLANIGEERLTAALQRGGPITTATLYLELLEWWLDCERARQDRSAGAPPPTRDELWYAVTALALRLWSAGEVSLGVVELGEAADALAALSVVDDSLRPGRDEAAYLIGSSTFLVRDDEGLFAFVHESVKEFLVARHVARLLDDGDPMPEPLRREMSELMINFLCGLADQGRLQDWVQAVLAEPRAPGGARANALRILKSTEIDITEPAQLGRADLRGKDLGQGTLRQGTLQGADLVGTDLTEADLIGADLVKTNLTGATLVRARLDRAQLAGAVLRGANLSGARLLGADLSNADLTGARLRGAALVGATFAAGALEAVADRFGVATSAGVLPTLQIGSGAAHVNALACDDQGELVAVGGGDGAVRIWETARGMQLRTLFHHVGPVTTVAFSPGGRWLASGGGDGKILLWDVESGDVKRTFPGHASQVASVAFSPDGRWLASGGDRTVRLWDILLGTQATQPTGHSGAVTAVAFSADGRWLVSGGGDRKVLVRDVASWSQPRELRGHAGWVRSVALSPDGRWLASGGDDGAVYLWDPATGERLRELSGHVGWVRSVAFSAGGRWLASGGGDGIVRVWDPATGERLRELSGHGGWVRSVAFEAGGPRLLSAGADGLVRTWDADRGGRARVWSGCVDAVATVAFSPDGRSFASCGGGKSAHLWDATTGARVAELADSAGWVQLVAFSPDGRLLAAAGDDGSIRMWNVKGKSPKWSVRSHVGAVAAVAFSPDGRWLATGGDRSVRLWDADTGSRLRDLADHVGQVQAMTFSLDGTWLASGTDDGMIRVWNPANREPTRKWPGHIGAVAAMATSAEGRWLASAGIDGKVKVWDPTTGLPRWDLPATVGRVCTVVFSPDGRWLVASGDDGVVWMWDAITGAVQPELRGSVGRVRSVAFSPDSRWLVSGGDDGSVRVFEVLSGRLRMTLLPLANGGWAAFADDLRYKLEGAPTGEFWYALGTCRFEPGELDPYIAELQRLPSDAPLLA